VRRAYLIGALLAVLVVGVPAASALDVAAPTLSSTPLPPANDNTPALTGTAAADSVVTIYSGGVCANPSLGTVAADAAGAFQFPVTVADNSTTTYSATTTLGADVSPCSAPFAYTEDSTPPPVPTINGHPTLVSNDTTPSFTFTDPEPGVTFNCRLTSGPYPSCSSPKSYAVTDGRYTFFVKASDPAGNSAEASFSWTVDTIPPPPPAIIEGPTNPSPSTSASFTFSAEAGATFRCRLDAAAFAPCSNPVQFTVADGSHTLVVEAVDAAGNVSGASAPYSWVVDTVHPLVTITDKPPLVTNRTSADFIFSATPSPDHYECSLDGAAFGTCVSPQHYVGLVDGQHGFSVRTVSSGGTRGAPTRYAWRVDTAPPQTAIATAPPTLSNSPTATFTFTSSEPGSTFVCSINSSGFTPCSSPQSYTHLGDGLYAFRVEAIDAAGNADASAALYRWRIAGVGLPTADLTPPANVKRVQRNVGYGRLQLRWRKPPDPDFDHVGVYVSTNPKTPPRKLVYSGKRQSFTDRRFKNGQPYRYLVVSYDRAKNASGGTRVSISPSALLKSPREGHAVRAAPLLRWTPVEKATFYNVQIYYRGHKVLSAWPLRARHALKRRWSYSGRSYGLRKGSYSWFVWPGFGPRAKSRYGHLLGIGIFRVR
jgi:hypothetical protein